MHQTSTGTKKTKKNKNSSNHSEVDPQFLEILVFLVFLVPVQVWCIQWFGFFGVFGACAGLVTLTSQNIDRHQKKQQKPKIPATTQKWTIVPGNFNFLFFPLQVWCIQWFVFFVFFGACAGLVHLLVCLFFLMPVQVLVILDCVCFGSWPYFKLMFQRSKHTVIFEQLCHHTGCLTLIFNSLTHVFVSQAFSLSLSV